MKQNIKPLTDIFERVKAVQKHKQNSNVFKLFNAIRNYCCFFFLASSSSSEDSSTLLRTKLI